MPSEASKTILVVEDVDAVRKMVCVVLRQHGYRCLEAVDGTDALRLLDDQPIHLLLTDVKMPKMGGTELARHVADRTPGTRILFMSGYSDDPAIGSIRQMPEMFLAKPFTPAALAQAVRQSLDHPWPGLPDHGHLSTQ